MPGSGDNFGRVKIFFKKRRVFYLAFFVLKKEQFCYCSGKDQIMLVVGKTIKLTLA